MPYFGHVLFQFWNPSSGRCSARYGPSTATQGRPCPDPIAVCCAGPIGQQHVSYSGDYYPAKLAIDNPGIIDNANGHIVVNAGQPERIVRCY